MFLSPAGIVLSWFRGLLSVFFLVFAGYLLWAWFDGLPNTGPTNTPVEATQSADGKAALERDIDSRAGRSTRSPMERVTAWRPGADRLTAAFCGAALLLVWSFAGRHLQLARLFRKGSESVPRVEATEIRRIQRPGGTQLHVEFRGPAEATTVILTHGWSLNSRQWCYLEHAWKDQFRIVVWDLPGLGQSEQPNPRDFSLEILARDLHAVIEASGPAPVVLMGHSIGGMIILTYCRLFPQSLGTRVSKLVLIHTTYTNPLQTMAGSSLFSMLQKPVIEPLLHLQIWFSPIVWCMNWLSYWNGSIHTSASRTGFAGTESWSDLDYVASFYPLGSPALIARGALAMLKYDATATLLKIDIPVLVIGADQDPITQLRASQKMADDISDGRLITLKPAKHFGLIEFDEEFAKQTAAFCAG